jgi:hypothetical protein
LLAVLSIEFFLFWCLGLKLNGAHQLLTYADDLVLLGDNIDTIKPTETVTDASEEVGLEINVEKTSICCSPSQECKSKS